MIRNDILLSDDPLKGSNFLVLYFVRVIIHSRDITRDWQEHQYVLMNIFHASVLAIVELFYQLHHYLHFLPGKVKPLTQIINVREGFFLF